MLIVLLLQRVSAIMLTVDRFCYRTKEYVWSIVSDPEPS